MMDLVIEIRRDVNDIRNPEGYKKISIKPDFRKVSTAAFLFFFVLAAIGITTQMVVWGGVSFTVGIIDIAVFIVLLVFGMFLHEAIHALSFMAFSQVSLSQLRFGIKMPYCCPYVHCGTVVPVSGFRLALLLPTLVTGLVPLIVGICLNQLMFTLLGIILTAGGIGDVVGLASLARLPGNAQVRDYPDQIGCDVFIPLE